MSQQPIPIDDGEILYRRIPVSQEWYKDGIVYGEAFEPRIEESSGISLFRKRFKTIEVVARGKSKKGYYVASLKVADIRAAGLAVVPQPDTADGWDDSHVEIPNLNASIRRTNRAEELQSMLAEIAGRLPIVGPYVS